MIRVAACRLRPASNSEARKIQAQAILMKAEAECIDYLCFPWLFERVLR